MKIVRTKVSGVADEANCPGVYAALGLIGLYALVQVGLIAALRRVAAWGWLPANFGGRVAGAIEPALPDSADGEALLTVVTITVAATLVLVLARRAWAAQWSRTTLPGVGFVRSKDNRSYLVAFLLGVGTLLVGGLAAGLIMLVGGGDIHQGVATLLATPSLTTRILMAILVVTVAPFVEELLFRGVLLSSLAVHMRVRWAVITSAVIFACLHLPDFHFALYPVPSFMLAGVALGWLRVRTGSLWPPIVMHATFNGFAASISLVPS